MHSLAHLDLTTRGGEAQMRSLLEDVVQEHIGIYPQNRLALAVWFGKSATPAAPMQNLLELFSGTVGDRFAETRFSLRWKTDSGGPPFVDIRAGSVRYFSEQLATNPTVLRRFFEDFEVLYYDKNLLDAYILEQFKIITEPAGLLKGWYVNQDQYEASRTFRDMQTMYCSFNHQVGLVKTSESADFANCKGIPHVEVDQRWLPLSSRGVKVYTFFNDLQDGKPGYFVFEGGSVYRLLRFEVTTAPQYGELVLERPRDDRYLEVYLRSVYPPKGPAA